MTAMKSHSTCNIVAVLGFALAGLFLQTNEAAAASAGRIDADSRAALSRLYRTNPKAREVGTRAVAVLVFPSIVKGGFVVAGQRGEGALIGHTSTLGYYSTTAASYGLQAGVQKFGYALF